MATGRFEKNQIGAAFSGIGATQRGFCVGKAALLAACLKALGAFADVPFAIMPADVGATCPIPMGKAGTEVSAREVVAATD